MKPNPDELYALGKKLREKSPRVAHADFKIAHDREDPVALLKRSSKGRIPELVPIRYGRMMKTPFTFYRGAALNMAADLAHTPNAGITVQACGDCHLMNFGAFATPERRVIFDINDLDETLPAPWEWDVKRLAASFVLACRDNSFSEAQARDSVLSMVRSYREHMLEYAEMPALEIWYDSIDVEKVTKITRDEEAKKRMKKRLAKAQARHVLVHDFPEMTEINNGRPVIKDQPPLIFHWRGLAKKDAEERIRDAFTKYRESLQEDRRVLLDRYELMDMAIKVVGVGSVGTFCSVVLLMANDKDPLFLQVKEARPSVLEPYAGASAFGNNGHRIVNGYRLMQSASDVFLGWTKGKGGREFYIRQLRDMKIKPLVEVFNPQTMEDYGALCGWTLARAHARSGAPALIAGYLGKKDTFDKAIADFAVLYANQNEKDHAVLMAAIRAGKIEVNTEAG
jgi:uncharacterized protein (DUF2252 family)